MTYFLGYAEPHVFMVLQSTDDINEAVRLLECNPTWSAIEAPNVTEQ
jgi:hypothetical protein